MRHSDHLFSLQMRKRYWFNKAIGEFVEIKKRPYRAIAPSIRTDSIDEYCLGTGKYYTSRSEKLKDLKRQGVMSLESNDVIKSSSEGITPDHEIEASLLEARNDLMWGNCAEITEKDRAELKEIDARITRK